MDKLTSEQNVNTKEKREEQSGFFRSLLSSVKGGLRLRRGTGAAVDIANFLIALVFARCHLIFGAHPLGFAYIAVLPSGVWLALLGAVVGSLTLGKQGIIYAMISVIVVFLRIIVSGGETADGEDSERSEIFREGLLLRMSASVIGGFITAVYEILLSGFSFTGALFGLSMIFLPPLLVFVMSGLFDTGPSATELLFSDKPLFSLTGKNEKGRFDLLFFQGAALLFIFLLSLALKPYELLGINASYVFASAITLITAKRFGSVRATAVGFASSFAVSGLYAAAFALLGLAAGALFKLGPAFALTLGGGAVCLWSIYAGGTLGVVTTLPEYAVAATLLTPVLRHLSSEKKEEAEQSAERAASEMVGTMALSYKAKRKSALDALESSLASMASTVRRRAEKDLRPSREELQSLILECRERYLSEGDMSLIGKEDFTFTAKSAAEVLYNKGNISAYDLSEDGTLSGLAGAINRAAAILAEEKYKSSQRGTLAEEMDLVSKLIREARNYDEAESRANDALTENIESILESEGLVGVGRAFGERVTHFIIAAEDESGTGITSPSLMSRLSSSCQVRLGTPEFFRRGKMALMECKRERSYRAECAIATVSGTRDEISGDTSRAFETGDGHFFSLISDGMGSGAQARDTSELVADLLISALDFGAGEVTVMELLNKLIRARGDECSATVDLFSVDLYTGESYFIKSGAAPSYIKRSSGARGSDSLFRIRSRTAPIGLLRDIDSERIRVELENEDVIVMLSDGITGGEDTGWLAKLLARPIKSDLSSYADFILSEAMKNTSPTDDMTVTVTRVRRIN